MSGVWGVEVWAGPRVMLDEGKVCTQSLCSCKRLGVSLSALPSSLSLPSTVLPFQHFCT